MYIILYTIYRVCRVYDSVLCGMNSVLYVILSIESFMNECKHNSFALHCFALNVCYIQFYSTLRVN